MFILTNRVDDKYVIYCTDDQKSEIVDKSKLLKAIKLGIKIIGVFDSCIVDNKHYINKLRMLSNDDYVYLLSPTDNLIVLHSVPDVEHVVIDPRVN